MSIQLPELSAKTADLLLNSCIMARRQNWSVLKASCPTVRDYLQGQITQDMDKLTDNCAIHSAILTPQGKAVSELYLLNGHHDEVILLTPTHYANATVARLRQFAVGHTLRAGMVDSLGICSIQGAHANTVLDMLGLNSTGESWLNYSRHADEDIFAMVMPRSPLGYWVVAPHAMIQSLSDELTTVADDELEAMRIIRGLPCFGREWDASMHPLNANLIEFNGVSFEKGCYVGQEVTSRMHWRGGIKKKLYCVAIDGRPDNLPCPVRTSVNIGILQSAAIDHEGQCTGIALLPIETAESATALSLGNGSVINILEPCHA
ncbi:MAG: folate-binding protein [Mariprofundus sp.]